MGLVRPHQLYTTIDWNDATCPKNHSWQGVFVFWGPSTSSPGVWKIRITYPPSVNGTFESMIFSGSRLVGYGLVPWRVIFFRWVAQPQTRELPGKFPGGQDVMALLGYLKCEGTLWVVSRYRKRHFFRHRERLLVLHADGQLPSLK